MFKQPRKNRKRELAPDEFGYTAIYKEILSQSFPSKKIENILYWFLAPLAMVFAIAISNATTMEVNFGIIINWLVLLFMIFSFLVIGAGWLVGFIFFSFPGVLPPLAWLTARMIVAIQSPYQNYYGLSASEIKHLLAIAETDQASADWKNGFLSIGVLALLLVAIQSSFQSIEKFINSYILAGPPKDFIFNAPNSLLFYGWMIVIAVIMLFAIAIFRPLAEFLAYEPINHTLVNACCEAIALLEAKGLSEKSSLTLDEKRIVIRTCNCLAVPISEKEDYWFISFVHTFEDENLRTWLLLPPGVKDPEIPRLIRFGRKVREIFRKVKLVFKSKK